MLAADVHAIVTSTQQLFERNYHSSEFTGAIHFIRLAATRRHLVIKCNCLFMAQLLFKTQVSETLKEEV